MHAKKKSPMVAIEVAAVCLVAAIPFSICVGWAYNYLSMDVLSLSMYGQEPVPPERSLLIGSVNFLIAVGIAIGTYYSIKWILSQQRNLVPPSP